MLAPPEKLPNPDWKIPVAASARIGSSTETFLLLLFAHDLLANRPLTS